MFGKSRFSIVSATCLLLLGLVAVSACGAAPATPANTAATADPRAGWPAKFVVGFFAGDDPNKVLESNEPFRIYLEKALGIPVELFTGTSYTAVVEAMRVDKVDAMEVGPFSYTLAVQEAKAEALAVSVAGTKGNTVYNPKVPPYYYSIVITKKGTGIASLADLKGKDFAFVDPASTSGHLMPRALLVKNGIDPDKDMKTIFAGSHPSAVLAVWNDKVPAAATFIGNLSDMGVNNQVEWCPFPDGEIATPRTAEDVKAVYDACPDGKIVIVAMTDPIPQTPFAVRSNLPESFKQAVRTALLALKDDAAFIKATNRWYVDAPAELQLSSLDEFYNPLREVAKVLNLDLKTLK